MTRIFIENNELDLTQALSRQITYAVDDLQNLDSKSTSFSKTIVIPGTARNNALLGNIFEFNNSNFTSDTAPNIAYNFNASKSAACRIEVNGLQIVKGIFRLTEILYDGDNVEYETAVFGELGGFIAKLGNGRLEDLNFSEYNHDYTIANIVASWNNAQAGSGYVYPHIDYGTYSTGKKNWKYGTFRPALFVKEYLEKIVTNSGYTLEFPLKETARFKSLIVPHNQKQLLRSTTNFVNATAVERNLLFHDGSDPLINPPVDKSPIPVSGTVTANFLNFGGGGEFQYIGATSASVRIRMTISGVATGDAGSPYFIGIKLGAIADTYGTAQFLSFQTVSTGDPYSFDFDFTTTLNTNDIIRLYACTDAPVFSFAVFNLTSTVSYFNISATAATLVQAVLGDALTINDIIPKNIFQRDFFTSILKLFNLYVTEDKFIEKKLIIKPYTDFYTGGIEDWSAKMDRAKQISIKPMSEVNARYYNFKFKDDSDFYNEQYRKRYNEGYGDRIFDNGLEFAKDTEAVDVIFSSTVLVGYGGEDKVYSTIFKQSNGNEENIDSVIRIMQCKKIDAVDSWHIQNTGGGNIHNEFNYCYAGHFDDPDVPTNDINFGAPLELFFVLVSGGINVNQFNLYYSSYMAEITDKDSRLLTAFFKLNEQDIFNLDFATFKYIDGGLYRLSKVMDYDAGANELTKCELLRVINTTY